MAKKRIQRARFYVGTTENGGQVFASRIRPCSRTATQYQTIIGPFKTRLAADYASRTEIEFESIAQIERLARQADIKAHNERTETMLRDVGGI